MSWFYCRIKAAYRDGLGMAKCNQGLGSFGNGRLQTETFTHHPSPLTGPDVRRSIDLARSKAARVGERDGWRRDLLHEQKAMMERDWADEGGELSVRRGRWGLVSCGRVGKCQAQGSSCPSLLCLPRMTAGTRLSLTPGYAGTTQRNASARPRWQGIARV